MYPTSKEFCDLVDNILTNSPLGNPTKANMYKTYGYSAETPLLPFKVIRRISKYHGKRLEASITLSKRGHLIAWKTRNPTYSDIVKALATAEHGLADSFVTLSKSPKSYIRTNVDFMEKGICSIT